MMDISILPSSLDVCENTCILDSNLFRLLDCVCVCVRVVFVIYIYTNVHVDDMCSVCVHMGGKRYMYLSCLPIVFVSCNHRTVQSMSMCVSLCASLVKTPSQRRNKKCQIDVFGQKKDEIKTHITLPKHGGMNSSIIRNSMVVEVKRKKFVQW